MGRAGTFEPVVALAVQLRALGAEVRVCAPPDAEFTELLAGVGVPLVPFGQPWRSWVRPTAPEERTRRVAEFIVAQYETVAAAAEECDALPPVIRRASSRRSSGFCAQLASCLSDSSPAKAGATLRHTASSVTTSNSSATSTRRMKSRPGSRLPVCEKCGAW
jgi:hypothetical protein